MKREQKDLFKHSPLVVLLLEKGKNLNDNRGSQLARSKIGSSGSFPR